VSPELAREVIDQCEAGAGAICASWARASCFPRMRCTCSKRFTMPTPFSTCSKPS